MSFTVNDFADFMDVLRAHPEWQADLRRILVDDELAELRRVILEHQQRTDEQFAELRAQISEQQLRTDERFEQLTARIDALAVQVAQIALELAELTRIVAGHTNDLAEVKGWALEGRYRDRAFAYFGSLLRRARSVTFDDVPNLWESYESGTISGDQWRDLHQLDVLIRGVDRAGRDTFVALEVAYTADAYDIERAERRAEALRLAGATAIPAVAAKVTDGDLLQVAKDRNVGLVSEGVVLFWPEPTAA